MTPICLWSNISKTAGDAIANNVKEMTPQRDDVIKSCYVVLYDSLI